jgi:ABC-type transporter Mla subunit MlaD
VTKNLRRAVIGFAVFVVACLVSALTLTAIFAQLRIQAEQTYHAEFTDVSGLAEGDFVRIAGVEVGKVKKISINQNNVAVVEFSADPMVVLTQGTKAALRWADPIGTRYMTLLEGAGGVQKHHPGRSHRTGAGSRCPAGRLPAAVPCAGSRTGQRPIGSADPGASGRGHHDRIVSEPNGGGDRHARRP